MIELTDQGKESLKEILSFAVDNDCLDEIVDQLHYLTYYGQTSGPKTKCLLHRDFAPLSMTFMMFSMPQEGTDPTGQDEGVWSEWFNGGLIYSGPGPNPDKEGVPLDGGSPSFTQSLDKDAREGKKHMWSVHT